MQGYGNHRLIRPYVKDIKAATTQGKLFDLGAFPALKERKDQVKGELIIIDKAHQEEALERMDILEGYPDFYRREMVKVKEIDSGRSHQAWTYIYNSEINDRSKLILNGNWKEVD